MIPFEIEYLRPHSAEAAVALHQEVTAAGKSARYLSGGTELVTMARDGKLVFDAVIDLKRIPEATEFDPAGMTFGAALRLSEIRDRLPADGALALLGQAAGGVADRTTRNSITLGGNICGMLPYREALLPLLLLDAEATIVGPDGARRTPILDVFDKRLKLQPGEFLLSVHLNEEAQKVKGFYRRQTREPRVDYPLVTLCMTRDETGYRLAVGGAFGPPVRSQEAEVALSEPGDAQVRAERAVAAFGESFRTDLRGSAEYRKRILELAIAEGVTTLGGEG